MKIRDATPADLPSVLELTARLPVFGPPEWRTTEEIVEGERRAVRAFFQKSPEGSRLLVAEEDGRAQGYALLETLTDYFTLERHGHVGILAVAAEAEGRGLARALLDAADAWARENGFSRMTLNVFAGNRHARDVYEHLGFAPETVRYLKLV